MTYYIIHIYGKWELTGDASEFASTELKFIPTRVHNLIILLP